MLEHEDLPFPALPPFPPPAVGHLRCAGAAPKADPWAVSGFQGGRIRDQVVRGGEKPDRAFQLFTWRLRPQRLFVEAGHETFSFTAFRLQLQDYEQIKR